MDKIQRFKCGGDGDPVEASFAVTLPVQIGDAKTWIGAFVVPGSTPQLISRRWLSQHRCVANFDPDDLCLESPEFGSVPLVLHSSGHLLLSLVNPSDTLDQLTVMIDCQKRDEQTMDPLQSRNQVADRRVEPDEERAADSSVVTGGSDPPDDFLVSLDEPNEEITEQWHDETISVQSANAIVRVIMERAAASAPAAWYLPTRQRRPLTRTCRHRVRKHNKCCVVGD